jgi:hypothetical protein
MKRKALTLTVMSIILIIALIAGFLWVDLVAKKEAATKLYTYPVLVGEKPYIITVKTNWTSEPRVYLPEQESKYVNCDFIGPNRQTVNFDITIPTDLIGGNISLIWKYYEQNPDRYILSNNGTYNSIQMSFNHTATDEHFEIHGTEGVLTWDHITK